MRTGRYRAASGQDLVDRIYSRRDVMEGYYLDGQMLTYSFWLNHALIYRYFLEDFLPRLPEDARVAEVGVGPGLMALTILDRLRRSHYVGVDLSAYSVRYAAALLAANDADVGRALLTQGDALAPGSLGGDFTAAICCEVLEHVEEPSRILAALRSAVRPEGLLFVTTVANIAAEDHIYLFRNEEHIRQELEDAGLRVLSERALTLRGLEDASPRPVNYAAVLAPIR